MLCLKDEEVSIVLHSVLACTLISVLDIYLTGHRNLLSKSIHDNIQKVDCQILKFSNEIQSTYMLFTDDKCFFFCYRGIVGNGIK